MMDNNELVAKVLRSRIYSSIWNRNLPGMTRSVAAAAAEAAFETVQAELDVVKGERDKYLTEVKLARDALHDSESGEAFNILCKALALPAQGSVVDQVVVENETASKSVI